MLAPLLFPQGSESEEMKFSPLAGEVRTLGSSLCLCPLSLMSRNEPVISPDSVMSYPQSLFFSSKRRHFLSFTIPVVVSVISQAPVEVR